MALFNKKKSQTPASSATQATTSSGGSSSDDFSDFSPEALGATADSAVDSAPAGKKGRKGGSGADKKASTGRAIKPGVAVGLNIGSDSIKAIELQAKGNDMIITGMGMVPTPAESISNGVVMSANALVMGIRDVLSQAGIKSKKVVTSVSGTGALVVRIIEVPKMSDGELEDNMKMDADRYIPFPPSEVIMDFTALRELPSDPDSANMEVLLAAAQREVIDLHVQVLQDAKLDPRSIDVEPLAAARALTHPLVTGVNGHGATNGAALDAEVDYNDVVAVLNVGASGTEISILRGDLLVFTRTVPTGGNALTQALVDTLGLAWSDAEQLKREMGDALPPSGASNAPGSSYAAAPTSDWSDSGVDNTVSDFNADSDESWNDFDTAPTDSAEEEFRAPTANPPAATGADPFADDFYEQGPDNIRQTEPGEQHQQKEPDDATQGSSGSPFSFDDLDAPSEKSEAEGLPTFEGTSVGTEGIGGDQNALDAGEEAILPSTSAQNPTPAQNAASVESQSTPAQPTEAANPFFNFGQADEPEDKLPTLHEGSPVSFADFLTEEEDDFADLPTLRDDSPALSAVPSAFEFPTDVFDIPTKVDPLSAPSIAGADDIADFSLPSFSGDTSATETFGNAGSLDPQEESLLPSESKTPASSDAFSFSFEDSLLATPEPEAAAPAAVDPFAEFMASAEPTVEPETRVTPVATSAPATIEAPAPAAPTDEDFDLDSLFSEAADGAGSAAAGGDSLDFGGLGGDDFAMDDAAFGAGLGGVSVGEIDAKTLHGVLEPVLENLINEVRRSLEYHTTRYPDAVVRRVVVTGGGANLKNLDVFFTQKLGIPTTVGNPVSRLTMKTPNLPSGYAEQNGPLFTVALGLAMRELTR